MSSNQHKQSNQIDSNDINNQKPSESKKVQFNSSFPTSNDSSDNEDNYHFNNYYGTMQKTKSLDSQISDTSSNLPEFNKRPLTDTPVVSSMASPDFPSDDTDGNLTEEDKKIERMKNISHLNLTDFSKNNLNTSISPTASQGDITSDIPPDAKPEPEDSDLPQKIRQLSRESASLSTPAYHKPSKPKPANDGSPKLFQQMEGLTMTPLTSQERLVIENEEGLKFEIPFQLQKKFEKTASIEKIKNLLNTKPKHKKAYTLNIPGQTSSKISPDGRIASADVGSKLVIVMVGLPARGKSYITNKLTRYLNWLQHDCRVFNVGNTRRLDTANNNGPENRPLPDLHTPNNEAASNHGTPSPKQLATSSTPRSPSHDADFFSPDNSAYTTLREKWAMDTLDQLLDYVLKGEGSVGIFDATNSTKRRRSRVLKRIQERSNGELKVLFLESVCTDPAIIESNIRLKLSGPDYRNMDSDIALKDFVGRLHNYEKAYEPIDESEEKIPGFQYVKMIDVGKKVVSYNVQGFLASQTIYFLLNFNLCERQIWITRHGESVDNLSGRIGGDSHLTKRGERFSNALTKFMNFQRQEFRKQQLKLFSDRLELRYSRLMKKAGNEISSDDEDEDDDETDPLSHLPNEPNFYVWTSMLTRAIETGQYFDDQVYSIKEMRMLNELGGGKFEGMTYEEIQKRYPKEYQGRIQNKLTYRYPGVGGESYLDVLTRLRPLITEIERTTDHLLIISHRVVLRILLAYFLNLDRSSIGELDVPLHTLYCLESKPYGTDYRMYEYDEALDWFVKVEPEHQKNIKEVGVLFKERKYSVIPTAPPSSRNKVPDIMTVRRSSGTRAPLRRSVSHGFR